MNARKDGSIKTLCSVLLPLALLGAACADSRSVECPEGTELSLDGLDCAAEMPGNPDADTDTPDAGPEPHVDPPNCDDGNECTIDGFDGDECASVAAADGTACLFEGGAGACESGTCVRDCEIEDCREVYPCTEQGLRDAVADGGETVIGCNGPTTIALTEGELVAGRAVSIDGLGLLTLDAEQQSRVLRVIRTAVVELIGIDITGGYVDTLEDDNGGGIDGISGTEITIRDCRIYGNSASSDGGVPTCGPFECASFHLIALRPERHGASVRGYGDEGGRELLVGLGNPERRAELPRLGNAFALPAHAVERSNLAGGFVGD